jgi:mannose-6-phosphate isomerase-like protein (cupin superfamily)
MQAKRKFVTRSLARITPFSFEGMSIRPLIAKEDTKAMVAYHIRIPAMTRIPHSYHKLASEVIHVLSGEGTVHLDRRRVAVKAKDSIFIQPRVWHSFSTGKKPLTVLAVLSPRADPKTDLYHR